MQKKMGEGNSHAWFLGVVCGDSFTVMLLRTGLEMHYKKLFLVAHHYVILTCRS